MILVTVNLTTTSNRLKLCRIALLSLLTQKRLPDRINVWVSSDAYLRDTGIDNEKAIDSLISSLPEAPREIVRVRWVDNIGPYRKLIPMLREASPEDIIVTADDDIFYGENWLEVLLAAYAPVEDQAVAGRVRSIRYNIFGRRTSYVKWPLLTEDEERLAENYIVTFGGGVVLSRALFKEEDIFDNGFVDLAPTADDLWYTMLLKRNRVKVKFVSSAQHELHFINHSDGLDNHNWSKPLSALGKVLSRIWFAFGGYLGVSVCANDRFFKNIAHYFRDKN